MYQQNQQQPDFMDLMGRLIAYHWPVVTGCAAGYIIAASLNLNKFLFVILFGVVGFVLEKKVTGRADEPSLPVAEPPIERVEKPAPAPKPVKPETKEPPTPVKPPAPVKTEIDEGPRHLYGAEVYPRLRYDPDALEKVIVSAKTRKAIKNALDAALNKSGIYSQYKVKPPKGILLYGPPGTGKTSLARAAAKVYRCTFFVVNASSLVSAYVGQTEQNVRNLFAAARKCAPSMIFFDEIDAIGQKRTGRSINSPSDLVLNTLLTELDGFRSSESRVVVMAATNRIDVLDEALTRSGRFDLKIEVVLPDKEAREQLFRLYLSDRPADLSTDDFKVLALYSDGLSPADIKTCCDRAALSCARKQARITRQDVQEAIKEIFGRGIDVKARPVAEVWAEINSLVGLGSVKDFLHEVEAVAKANVARREKGLAPLKQSFHMCFTGNPGTGKTTIARLTGELLASLGALPSGHLIETDRSGLVAAYVGQTAIKVQEKVEAALGGVLFVDEAYSLARGGETDFGREALDILVKCMEDYRGRLVVILAGYTSEMQALFAMNPGMKSRIAFICEFPDYAPEELLQIAKLEAQKQGFTLTTEAGSALLNHFQQVDIGAAGNGRYARKLIEQAIRKAVMAGRDGTLKAEDFV